MTTTSRHDIEEYRDDVVALAERLRAAGVARYEGPSEPDAHATKHIVLVFYPPESSGLRARLDDQAEVDEPLQDSAIVAAQKMTLNNMDRDLFGEPEDA